MDSIERHMMVGAIAGIVLVTTTGFLITGYAFHPLQKLTPATWRRESARNHALAVLWATLAGAAMGTIEAQFPKSDDWQFVVKFAALLWAAAAAPVIATLATYVNLHVAVVIGLLLEWLVFCTGVSLACHWWAT